MAGLRFSAKIERLGINPYVRLSASRAKALKSDWKKPIPVLVRINGKPDEPWHINMMPAGDGSYYLYLHGSVRKASDTKVGDMVEVELSFYNDYRNGPQALPEWFSGPLGKSSAAKKSWEALSPSRQKEIVRYFANLKSDTARQRNLEKVMHILSGKEGRFMARDWKDGK
jgi:hypothetical protein